MGNYIDKQLLISDLKSEEVRILFRIFEKLSTILDQDTIRKEIFEDLLNLFKADFLASYIWNESRQVFENGMYVNMSPENLDKYKNYYQFHDPITPLLQKQRNATRVCDVLPQKELENTEFFNDFLKKDGLHHGMNVYAYDGDLNIGDLRIWRARNRPDFEKRELALLNVILPHFRNALRNIRAVNLAKEDSKFWNKLFESSKIALFLFDEEDKLVFQNQEAVKIEKKLPGKEYISFFSHVCSIACSIKSKTLNQTEWGSHFFSVLNILSPETARPMIVVLAYEKTHEKIDKKLLTAKYRLTPRETEICLLVCKGLIDQEIASVLGIAFYTVRSHIKNIFQKVEVTNRSELISALFEGIVEISF